MMMTPAAQAPKTDLSAICRVFLQCNNGVDDDFDDKIDYPFDPGCATRGDVNETDPVTVPACFNGIDDDGDGLADIPLDPGCTARGDDDRDRPRNPACMRK